MAQLPQPFNAHSVEPAGIQTPQLPISDNHGHPVIIVASEFKPSKGNANNGYLELSLSIIDGPHKGETGAYRLNLFHENAQTVDIASRQLSALCYVTGQMMISDSAQLHNIPFRAIVGNQKPDPNKPDGPVYTQVTGVLDIHGNKPVAGGTPAPQQSAPTAAFAAPTPPQAAAPAPWAQSSALQAAPAPQQAASSPTAPPWAR